MFSQLTYWSSVHISKRNVNVFIFHVLFDEQTVLLNQIVLYSSYLISYQLKNSGFILPLLLFIHNCRVVFGL